VTQQANFVLLSALVAIVSAATAQTATDKIARLKAPDAIKQPRREVRQYQTMRIIDDPGTGTKWVVERDVRHPSGPEEMVLVSDGGRSVASRDEHQGNQNSQKLRRPIIHSGDLVIAIEKGNVLDASFEGVAVSSAGSGEPVIVRLKIGGHTFEGIAIEPGRVRLLPETTGAHR